MIYTYIYIYIDIYIDIYRFIDIYIDILLPIYINKKIYISTYIKVPGAHDAQGLQGGLDRARPHRLWRRAGRRSRWPPLYGLVETPQLHRNETSGGGQGADRDGHRCIRGL